MNRRNAVRAVLALAAGAKLAFAQSRPGKSARVGLLFVSEGFATLARPISEALQALGWVEGKNLLLDWRIADGRPTELPALATELVRHNPDVIVVPTNFEAEVVLRATRTIPLVVAATLDPVETLLAQSLAHPGGSVTGVIWADPRLASKMVQILHESVPNMRRLAILYDERYVGLQTSLEAHQVAADAIHLEVRRFPVRSREDVDRALTSSEKEHVDGSWCLRTA